MDISANTVSGSKETSSSVYEDPTIQKHAVIVGVQHKAQEAFDQINCKESVKYAASARRFYLHSFYA